MLQDSEKFEQYAKMALDSEQQFKKFEKQTSKELASTEFCHTATPDFDEGERVIRAQNQAPLDMVAELKAIHERLDAEQTARISAEVKAAAVERRQEEKDRRNLKIAIISCIASVVAAIVGVLTFLNVYP